MMLNNLEINVYVQISIRQALLIKRCSHHYIIEITLGINIKLCDNEEHKQHYQLSVISMCYL